MKKIPSIIVAALLFSLYLSACHSLNNNQGKSDEGQANMRIGYDDSILTNKTLPIMMPYNRLINPAGKVIRFGSASVENHSLDVQLIPYTTLLVVEDRFGITLIDTVSKKVVTNWSYSSNKQYRSLMSTYSGVKVRPNGSGSEIFWSAADGSSGRSFVMQAGWDGKKLSIINTFPFKPVAPSPLALPNELIINNENGTDYLYVVLNGNNQLVKIDLNSRKTVWTKATGVAPYGIAVAGTQVFITNWGGPMPGADTSTVETAGVPYGKTYINPKTGATLFGSVQVYNQEDGSMLNEITVGLHPNAIIASKDGRFLYVANANSDKVSVIAMQTSTLVETIPVRLMAGKEGFIGDSPNALSISNDGLTLYVANGLDNAVAVLKLGTNASTNGKGQSQITGFIPTEAYPGGLLLDGNTLFVTNLEGEGSRVGTNEFKASEVPADVIAYNSHHELATLSVIPLPDKAQLKKYTDRVKTLNLTFREKIAKLIPRKNIEPKPVPERIGEPSVFNHVLYIIKENRTYDQVLGDMPEGNGAANLCTYGNKVTPNQHQLARDFLLLDNYYASGKCSAEGHQWTDAAMVTDYVEKNVRAWFRSYPHVQEDALVYDVNGFIWNNAADHGKTVRIYGEASAPHYDEKLTSSEIYKNYMAGLPFKFYNTSTISRVRPMLSQNYPGSDELKITDQIRASAFIKELNDYEGKPGDALPQLMVMALSTDHTAGTRSGMPKPESMVADNDLALGRIIEAVSKSKFWKNTVIFVTEDDSQAGWDHVSAYRTTGFVVSPYSNLKRTISTNYNQTSVVRTIEQILGIPPMNIVDATALPMFDCFSAKPTAFAYTALKNLTPLNDINPGTAALTGKALYYAKASALPEFDHVDGGRDDLLNRILWYAAKGKKTYPAKLAGKDND
jgi:YVTN family beta-propeller protein